MKALIVEDSKIMRQMFAHYLKSASFEVVMAEDGLIGLDKIDSDGPFDLILVDWEMPNMNGIEFIEKARNEKDVQSKILMATSHNEMEDITTAMSVGIDDFIIKPVDEDELKEKLTLQGF